MRKLPKMYSPVRVRFSSLRNGVGAGLGVIYDIDTMVERVVVRIKTACGWKWQIKDFSKLFEYDYYVEVDQEILDMYPHEVELV